MNKTILLSAYACEPNRGSESEIAWSWIKLFSKTKNNVYVITRKKNSKKIQQFKFTNIFFLYYDLPNFLIFLTKGKRNKGYSYLYFLLWQLGIFFNYNKFISKKKFDVIHHITFGSFRFPSFLCLFKSKFIFGPLAGGETVPFRLLENFTLKSKLTEFIRNLSNNLIKYSFLINLTFFKSFKIILTSRESLKFLPKRFILKSLIIPAVSNKKVKFKIVNSLKFKSIYFAGRLVEFKGIYILLEVFKKINLLNKNLKLNIYGDGPCKLDILKFINDNNLQKKIIMHGELNQKKLLKSIKKNDLLIFPTLRDSGGYAILEALNNNIDVISTNAAGPSSIIESSSIKLVDIQNKSNEAIISSFVKTILNFYKKKHINRIVLNPYLIPKNKYKIIYKNI